MSSVEFWMAGVGIGVLFVFGIFAICISVVLLCRIKGPFAYSLLGLSTFDASFITSSFFGCSLPVMLSPESSLNNEVYLEWMENVNDVCHAASIYCTVTIASERVLGLYYPFLYKRYITPRTVVYLWVVVVLIASLIQCLKIVEYPAVSAGTIEACGLNETQFFEERGVVDFRYVDYYVQLPYIFVIIVFPFIVLTILNGFVIWKVWQSRKFQVKHCSGCVTDNSGSTSILVGIVVVFLICQLGCISVVVCRYSYPCFYFSWQSALFAVDMFLLTVNSSINFIVYFVCGSKFRQELRKLFNIATPAPA